VGRSRGGLTTKIHARVDGQGRPIQILITPGQVHDLMATDALLANLKRGTILIADKAYDADRLRDLLKARGAIANIPNMIRRKRRFRWKKAIYRQRNLIERFFNAQTVPPYRNPLRQARPQLPGFPTARRGANFPSFD
jgi:transposase